MFSREDRGDAEERHVQKITLLSFFSASHCVLRMRIEKFFSVGRFFLEIARPCGADGQYSSWPMKRRRLARAI